MGRGIVTGRIVGVISQFAGVDGVIGWGMRRLAACGIHSVVSLDLTLIGHGDFRRH